VRELIWIDECDALALHDRLLALDGGAAGVRNVGVLQSALARPQQLHAYGDMAAAYTVGIVRNRPFVDGNKRTAFVVGVLFLELNGHRFTATEEDATQAVLGLAAGAIDEASFTRWLRANVNRSPR
jgi:death-on-curing protein